MDSTEYKRLSIMYKSYLVVMTGRRTVHSLVEPEIYRAAGYPDHGLFDVPFKSRSDSSSELMIAQARHLAWLCLTRIHGTTWT